MQVDAAALTSAVKEVAESKAISVQAVVDALEEALRKAYIKSLGGGDDAIVESKVDLEKGIVSVYQLRKVVKEVEDDYLEISEEEANEGVKKGTYKIGDLHPEPEAPLQELSKAFITSLKSLNKMNLAEAERTALYDIYKDHIGEMMTATVDKADDRSVTVNIGHTKVELGKKELIGNESFKVGDQIKVYIQEVKAAPSVDGRPAKGPQIEATRSSEGFLKRLFEEEIHEVYDGTVIIKAIARQAGVRSKVAVTSNNEDVDPTGACIGPAGSRIQKVVAQLGNGAQKEKIDVINYSPNPGAFIIEACRPAQVLGVELLPTEEGKTTPRAIVVIQDGDRPLALGKFKANLTLAGKLTGYQLELKELSEALKENIAYTPTEEWIAKAEAEKAEREKAAYLQASKEAVRRSSVKKEAAPAPIIISKVEEEVIPEPVKKEEAAKDSGVSVKTTTTLEDLEKELSSSKKKAAAKPSAKRPRKITEEEVKHDTPKATISPAAMPIYTQEELSLIEEEESSQDEDIEEYEDEEEDYSEYDYDEDI